MDYTLKLLIYGGIIILAVLLILFEFSQSKKGHISSHGGYEYYTDTGERLRVCHIIGMFYKIYVFGNCPVEAKKDRNGSYFCLHGRSAAEIEHKIDEIYKRMTIQ